MNMKSNFYAAPNLMMLEETLKDHEPYAVINVSTTGLDNSEFDKHSPTRVCVQEYVWNESSKRYDEGLSFDKTVKCNDEALQKALEPNAYDVFENGGIDREAYIKGEGVLEQAEFAKAYSDFMESLKKETMLIANGASFAKHYLDKIGCGDSLQNKIDNYKLLDQTHLTREYFAKNNISSSKNTLEAMRDHLTGAKGDKIIGGDSRIKVINDFVTRYGRDTGVLEDEMTSHFRMADAEQYQSFVDSGVEKYRNADFEGKLTTLTAKGVINAEAVIDRESDCNINRLFDVLEGKNGNRGFTVMQVATTGFHAGNAPIQITAAAYELKDGVPVSTNKGIAFNIQADRRSLQQALQEADKGKFDAFKYTGINRDEYVSGKKVVPQEEALKRISNYFKAFTPSDFPIITNGTANSGVSFSQDCLKTLGNLPAFDAPHIDFTQAVKEYCYLAYNSDEYPKNAILNENTWSEKTFGLEDIAKHNDAGAIDNTKRKCLFVGLLVKNIAEQQNELFRNIDEEKFMEDDGGYSNIMEAKEKAADEKEYIEDEVLANIVDGDYVTKPLGEQGQHGNLYSDVRGDKIDVVQSDNVQKIGEAPIKHISEAFAATGQQTVDVNLLVQTIADQNKMLMEQNKMLMKVLEEQSQMLKAALGLDRERSAEKVPFRNMGAMEGDLSIHKQNKAEKSTAEKQLA